jgi:hypothetical protein
MLVQAHDAIARRAKDLELLPLAVLAKQLGVHVRTLQAAARTGRLKTHFSIRCTFGRPMRFASRAAGAEFLRKHYRCFGGQESARFLWQRVVALDVGHKRVPEEGGHLSVPELEV